MHRQEIDIQPTESEVEEVILVEAKPQIQCKKPLDQEMGRATYH